MRHSPRRFSVKLSDGDLRRLRVFCAVTRCGGFAAAESELQMGLPSISRVIKDVEIRLGVRLCRRATTRPASRVPSMTDCSIVFVALVPTLNSTHPCRRLYSFNR